MNFPRFSFLGSAGLPTGLALTINLIYLFIHHFPTNTATTITTTKLRTESQGWSFEKALCPTMDANDKWQYLFIASSLSFELAATAYQVQLFFYSIVFML